MDKCFWKLSDKISQFCDMHSGDYLQYKSVIFQGDGYINLYINKKLCPSYSKTDLSMLMKLGILTLLTYICELL